MCYKDDVIIRRRETINIIGTRRDEGRPGKTLLENMNKDWNTFNLTKNMIFYRKNSYSWS